jgi:hypothetical protein
VRCANEKLRDQLKRFVGPKNLDADFSALWRMLPILEDPQGCQEPNFANGREKFILTGMEKILYVGVVSKQTYTTRTEIQATTTQKIMSRCAEGTM